MSLYETIKKVLDANESACLDSIEDKERVAQALVKALEPTTVDGWAREVHLLAKEKGWWEECVDARGFLDAEKVKNKVAEKLNLIHDEVSEGSGEARKDRWFVYWDVPGFGIVTWGQIVASISTAASDPATASNVGTLLEALGLNPRSSYDLPQPKLHALLADIETALIPHKPEGFGIEIVDGIIRSLDLLHTLGFNTEKLMEIKHAHNKTRPYRHGNKRF